MGDYDIHIDQDFDVSMYDLEGIGQVIAIIYLFVIFISLAVGAVFYVLQSIGYYKTAKRRGISNPWLAWVPVGINWIMGCVSDQYQYVVKGRICNKRKAMLALSIITLIVSALFCVAYFVFLWNSMGSEMVQLENIMVAGLLTVLSGLVMTGVSIALTVLQYITLYDLFASSDPKNAVLFIILSIIFNFTMPIFMFACRNKDAGMPPRKEPAQAVPQPIAEPWEQSSEA